MIILVIDMHPIYKHMYLCSGERVISKHISRHKCVLQEETMFQYTWLIGLQKSTFEYLY